MKRNSPQSAERLSITPLIDIAFLVIIFFMALPMRRLDGKLEAHLPTGDGIETYERPHTEVVPIWVRQESYQLGDRFERSAWDLTPVLELLGPNNIYSIRAAPGIKWKRVVEAVDVLRGLKYVHVRFYGTELPPERIRRLSPLPLPG